MRSLYGGPGLQGLPGYAQDDEDMLGLLEDLREAIGDYKVRSQSSSPFSVLTRTTDGATNGDIPSNVQLDC